MINEKEGRINIKDPFMLKYLNMTGKQILTYGSIGKLIFYQDFTLSNVSKVTRPISRITAPTLFL